MRDEQHEPLSIIAELDFVLTHPTCNVQVLEKYYNNWLLYYDTVPLFSIIGHMKKTKPRLLKEWSRVNKTVLALLDEMEPNREKNEEERNTLTVHIDVREHVPGPNGIYQITWETELEEPVINAHFKTKTLHVIDREHGRVTLVGVSHHDANRYHLYVKKGRKQNV